MLKRTAFVLALLLLLALGHDAFAQDGPEGSPIDTLRLDAPALAHPGSYAIGVRTLELVNPGQLDIANAPGGAEIPTYDRPLTVEVWYPAVVAEGTEPAIYHEMIPDGTTIALHGVAVRDAVPLTAEGPFPLVILSHGYLGERYLMSHLGEHLATWGYVVASIEHTDSTFDSKGPFASTLVNRPLDQIFVIDQMQALNADETSFLAGLVDANNVAITGFSMGGYGALNVAGAGYTSAAYGYGVPAGALAGRQTGNFEADPRVKAVVALAPCCMEGGYWDAEGLAGVHARVLFIAGTNDNIAGYESGTRAIFEGVVNSDRYLLTLIEASHNVGSMTAPAEILAKWEESRTAEDYENWGYYGEPIWDKARMNDILQHFMVAFLNRTLKGDETVAPYLDVRVANLNDTNEYNTWPGFHPDSKGGLILEHRTPGS